MKIRCWMQRILILCILMNLTANNAFSQVVRCATMENEEWLRQQFPDLETPEQFEAWLADKIQQKREMMNAGLIIDGVYQIPVIVHVVHNGEAVGTGTNISFAAIQSQIDVLNEDFRRMFGTPGWNTHPDGADTQIEFCLARRKPDGTAFANNEYGVNRINRNTAGFTAPPYTQAYVNSTIKPYCTVTQGWSPEKYMNFWSLNLGNSLLGYAQFPTSVIGGMGCGTQSANTDGVVMLYSSIGKSAVTGQPAPYNEGRTATHEIGHWLGLRHIWGDANNCTGDDYCNDTPMAAQANYNCPVGTNSCTTTPIDAPDMIENYMDYTYDACMNIFTYDQRMRMRTVLENSPIRASLITSDACIPPAVNDASIVNIMNPKGDNCNGSITPTVVLKNRGTANLTSATIQYTIDGMNAVNYSWTGNLATGQTVNVTLAPFSTTLGTHIFRAVSLNPNGQADPHTDFDASEIAFAVSNGFEPGYVQDFDGGSFPPDVKWRVENPNADCFAWVGAAAVSSTGVANNACAMMTNYQNGTNADEYLYTPIFRLPCGSTSPTLTFDVAYRRRATTVNDRLRVEISTDCGATWQTTAIYDKNGTTLATSTTVTNAYWVPTAAADWRNETVSLSSFVGANSTSIQFRFRATNAGNGGNLYVDNVKFTAVQPVEIDVYDNSVEILDDGYSNFGEVVVGSSVTKTFTVKNNGTSSLTLNNPITITGSSAFSVTSTFGALTIPANGTTTFSVTFTPSVVGSVTANLSFINNDCDEGTYNFQLQGIGKIEPPVADFTANVTTICAGSTVVFSSTSTNAIGFNWTFAGGTPSSATTEGPHTVTYNTAGTYTVSLTATNDYGSDTETKTAYITVLTGAGEALPLVEGFVGTTFPPAGWSISNGGNQSVTWARNGTRGTAPTAGNSAVINLFTTNTTGDIDDLNLPAVSLSGMGSATMTFDVAYARYNNTTTDQLDVLVSNDCGQTYTIVYSKSGANLATMANQTTALTNPTTWRNETIDLTPYVGSSKVDIKIRAISGYGQYLYIDNVNVTGVPNTAEAAFTSSAATACVGSTVTFTDNSTGATSYDWNFGAGATPSTATGAGPHTVTYTTSGSKSVTLTINGSASTATETIVVNNKPSPPSINVVNNCGQSVLTTTGAGLIWSNGATSPTITVTNPGTYSVTQTINGCTSDAGSATASPIAIPAAPVVTVVNNCGSSILSSTGSALLWSNGETTSSITVSTAGTYTVTQTVNGCQSAAGSIVAAPIAVPAVPNVSVVNACGTSTLTTTGSSPLWSTGATTSTISVSSAGSYTVTQSVNGCESEAATVVANPLVVPSAPVVTVSNGCGSSVLSTTGTGLVWSNGATSPTITVNTAGTYTVTQTQNGCTSAAGSAVANPSAEIQAPILTVENNCGSSVLTASGNNILWSTGATTNSITVTIPGTYTATQSIGNCVSEASSIVANPSTAPPAPITSVNNQCGYTVLSATGTNLQWSTGEVTSEITVYAAGTYSVIQIVDGCESASSIVVASPGVTPSAPQVSVVNNCGSTIISATGVNLQWSTGETTAQIVVTTAGTFYVSQTVNGCASATTSAVSAPLQIPSVAIETIPVLCSYSDPIALTSGTPTGGVYGGNGVINGLFYPSQAGLGATLINYTYTAGNGCSATAQTVATVDACLAIEEVEVKFILYPNPVNSQFSIYSSEAISLVEIYDMTGRLVFVNELASPRNELIIDVANLSDGIYQVKTRLNDQIRLDKLEVIK